MLAASLGGVITGFDPQDLGQVEGMLAKGRSVQVAGREIRFFEYQCGLIAAQVRQQQADAASWTGESSDWAPKVLGRSEACIAAICGADSRRRAEDAAAKVRATQGASMAPSVLRMYLCHAVLPFHGAGERARAQGLGTWGLRRSKRPPAAYRLHGRSSCGIPSRSYQSGCPTACSWTGQGARRESRGGCGR